MSYTKVRLLLWIGKWGLAFDLKPLIVWNQVYITLKGMDKYDSLKYWRVWKIWILRRISHFATTNKLTR